MNNFGRFSLCAKIKYIIKVTTNERSGCLPRWGKGDHVVVDEVAPFRPSVAPTPAVILERRRSRSEGSEREHKLPKYERSGCLPRWGKATLRA